MDIAEVKEQNKKIQKTNSEIEKSVEYIHKEYENIREVVELLQKERLEERQYIAELEKKVDDLQRSSRSSAVEIRNVPLTENESTSDIADIVLKTCDTIEANINESDLRDVFRLPGKKGTTRPILAEFLTVSSKNKVLKASRTFNKVRQTAEKLNTKHIGVGTKQQPIYVAEHLFYSMRQLFYEARVFAKQHRYRFCWIQDSKILLREDEGY